MELPQGAAGAATEVEQAATFQCVSVGQQIQQLIPRLPAGHFVVDVPGEVVAGQLDYAVGELKGRIGEVAARGHLGNYGIARSRRQPGSR